ncbi:secreted RxLR effector protein 161-like [Stegodyphus dumicola]|uniref:secreted RxLR effector protein 161-like n=1 Tax=Stegodyphus dumicola TaxID=202533 RepID=UPI0015A8F97D|nr:secreted RxLR effector protein 161-like [Stegodyphus dumicola]
MYFFPPLNKTGVSNKSACIISPDICVFDYGQPNDDGMIKIKEAKPLSSEIYRSVVGSLLYLAMSTRPDIAYPVSLMSRKLNNATEINWEIVQTTLRYLRSTIEPDIVYNNEDDRSLMLFSDADNNSCAETRKSRTGAISFYGGGAITWRSKLQEAISNSMTEVEKMAAADATKDLIWLKSLFSEIANNVSLPILQIDDQSTIK